MTTEEQLGATEHPSDGNDDDELSVGSFGSPVADRVYDLLAPVVATTGTDLVDVRWVGGSLQLAVDRDDGITTDALAEISRLVSPLLDQHDPVPGRYTLEVSSPGVERPLRRAEHFARAVGEVVIVKTVPGCEPRRLRGLLRTVEDGQLRLDVDEIDGIEQDVPDQRIVALSDVASARTHFEWGPTPKPGGKGKKKGKGGAVKGKGGAGKGKAATGVDSPPNGADTTATNTTTEEERGRT